MIERYTLPEMGRVWSEAHKDELWGGGALVGLGGRAPEAVAEGEAVTAHDVIAFLPAWADNTEPRAAAAWVHYGMTSSDLLDTALAVQLVEATDIILAKADRLAAAPRDHGVGPPNTLR